MKKNRFTKVKAKITFGIICFLMSTSVIVCNGQITKTFVYDDGTIQSGYFEVTIGSSGIYWFQGANPTPYSLDISKRNKSVVAPIIMNSSLATPRPRNCNVSVAGSGLPLKGVSTSPGLAIPFTLTFGINTTSGVSVQNTVDISANPILSLTYSKPYTPASDYYVIGYTDGSSDFPSSNPNRIRIFNASTTSFGAGNGIYGNINAGFGAGGPNSNSTPLRFMLIVEDINGNQIELGPTVGGTLFNWRRLGFTMSTAAGVDINYTVNLSGLGVLDYNTNPYYPNNPYICANGGLGKNGCPAVKGNTNVTNPSLFDLTKIAKVLFFLSPECGGKLSIATTLGICGYGTNFTCYDNTFTISSFSLGSVPADAPLPTSFSICSVAENSVSLTWDNPAGSIDSIVIAKSNFATGGWGVWKYIKTENYPSNTGIPIYDNSGSPGYYKIGSVNGGKITWSPNVGYSCNEIVIPATPTKTYYDGAFLLNATVSSGLPIIYTSSNINIISITGNLASIVGLGTVTITASVSGNGTYPSTFAKQVVNVIQSTQTITGFPVLPDVTFSGTSTLNFTASATSGLPVVYTLNTTPASGVAFLGTNSMLILGHGTVSITGSQVGNAYYSAAPSITRVFNVAQQVVSAFSDDTQNGDLNIYPNPNKGTFTISYRESDGSLIEILNNQGLVVRRFDLNQKEANMQGLPQGLLFVRFKNRVYKVLVE